MSDLTSNLKPCPFCGGPAAYCDEMPDEEPHQCHHIVCTECGMSADFSKGKLGESLDFLKGECSSHWNRRTPPEATGVPFCWAIRSKHGLIRGTLLQEPSAETQVICANDGDTLIPLYAGAPVEPTVFQASKPMSEFCLHCGKSWEKHIHTDEHGRHDVCRPSTKEGGA